MITVDMVEYDITNALKTLKNTPVDFAISRALKIDIERIEVKYDKVVIWMYDDSDYISYKFSDEDTQDDVDDFIAEWEAFLDDETIEEFSPEPFSFNLEENHDPRTDSRHWTATSFDYEQFADDPVDGFKNKSRNRLTDDDDWV